MLSSDSGIAMAGHNSKILMYDFPPKVGKRFRDDFFVVWTHDTGRIKFTTQIADDLNGLEFLDLKIKYLNCKLSDVYSKPTHSFTCVMPSTCYPIKSTYKVPPRNSIKTSTYLPYNRKV